LDISVFFKGKLSREEAVSIVLSAISAEQVEHLKQIPQEDQINEHFGFSLWVRNLLGHWVLQHTERSILCILMMYQTRSQSLFGTNYNRENKWALALNTFVPNVSLRLNCVVDTLSEWYPIAKPIGVWTVSMYLITILLMISLMLISVHLKEIMDQKERVFPVQSATEDTRSIGTLSILVQSAGREWMKAK
jgi:hypothetical protein